MSSTLNAFPKTKIITHRALCVFFSVLLLFLSAQFSIPWQPVPLTFQSATVLFLAMTLPSAEVMAAVVAYLGLGLVGLPMFEGFSSGFSIVFGATGGYLLGFIPAAIVCNFLREKFQAKSFLAYLALSVLGIVIIFTCGVLMLTHFVGIKSAYLFGVQPFLLSESAKTLLLASVLAAKDAI